MTMGWFPVFLNVNVHETGPLSRSMSPKLCTVLSTSRPFPIFSCAMALCSPEDRKIKNPTLAQAVKALLSNGKYENISKKDGEMIIFEQPITYYGRSSGIVYTLSTTKVPNVEYAIEIKPLPESGWYYFVSDPDQWRVEQTKSA